MSSNQRTRTTWREREAEKARAARLQHIANTEENFPSTMAVGTNRTVALSGMAERVLEAHIQEEVQRRVEAYRASMEARERRNMVNSTYFFRRNRNRHQEDEEEEGTQVSTVNDTWPGHGKRGTFTEPDEEGWRTVVKRIRRKRELTDEELERKWRADILHEEGGEEEQGDYNGELSEADQRREFY